MKVSSGTAPVNSTLSFITVFGTPLMRYAWARAGNSCTSTTSAVTLEDARNVGLERVHPDHLKVLVVGDREVVEPGLRELGLPVVLLDSDGAEEA